MTFVSAMFRPPPIIAPTDEDDLFRNRYSKLTKILTINIGGADKNLDYVWTPKGADVNGKIKIVDCNIKLNR